jgi:hypothetical protein
MAKAICGLSPAVTVSKLDPTDRTRETFRLAYRQARSMIRDGGQYGYGARYVWALDHMRRRFGASGWPVVQAAARVAFDLRAVSKAATGTSEQPLLPAGPHVPRLSAGARRCATPGAPRRAPPAAGDAPTLRAG